MYETVEVVGKKSNTIRSTLEMSETDLPTMGKHEPVRIYETMQSPVKMHEPVQSPARTYETVQSPEEINEPAKPPLGTYENVQLPVQEYEPVLPMDIYEPVQPPDVGPPTTDPDYEYEEVGDWMLQGASIAKGGESYAITECLAYNSVNRS